MTLNLGNMKHGLGIIVIDPRIATMTVFPEFFLVMSSCFYGDPQTKSKSENVARSTKLGSFKTDNIEMAYNIEMAAAVASGTGWQQPWLQEQARNSCGVRNNKIHFMELSIGTGVR